MKKLGFVFLGLSFLFVGVSPAFCAKADHSTPPLEEDVAMVCPRCGKVHKPTTKCSN